MNWGVEDLQSSALPLGYAAKVNLAGDEPQAKAAALVALVQIGK